MSEHIKDDVCQTEDMRKIFVGNIKTDATNEELKAFLEQHCGAGTIADCSIVTPRAGTTPKYKMGFVTFFDSDSPDDLFLSREKLEFKSVKLDVKRAIPKSDDSAGAKEKSTKIFIANLPKKDCTEEELKKYFTERHNPKYGEIQKVQLIKEKDSNGTIIEDSNLGYGFIYVSSEDLADKIHIQHRHFMFKGRKIEVKKSVPTNDGFGGGRGRGGPRGGGRGGRGGPRGGGAQWGNQGGYGAPSWDQGGYGGEWDQGYGGGYEGGYDDGYGGGQGGYGGGYAQGGYGGGYGAGGGRGGRGAGGRGGRGAGGRGGRGGRGGQQGGY